MAALNNYQVYALCEHKVKNIKANDIEHFWQHLTTVKLLLKGVLDESQPVSLVVVLLMVWQHLTLCEHEVSHYNNDFIEFVFCHLFMYYIWQEKTSLSSNELSTTFKGIRSVVVLRDY